MKDVIGRGHFGEVQVVTEKSSGTVYAMKILSKHETLAQQEVNYLLIFLSCFKIKRLTWQLQSGSNQNSVYEMFAIKIFS